MTWKIYITAFVSFLFTTFPQNLIGCGDSQDPYDYFTSFFTRTVTETNEYRPFYYTSLLTFYDDWSWDQPLDNEKDDVLREWKDFCGKKVTTGDAAAFIYYTKHGDVDKLYQHLTANKALQVPDSMRNNQMTKCFIENKDAETLRYLLFAKKTEVVSSSSDWEARATVDSLTLNKYITEANDLFGKSNTAFLKNKYAFQRCKLAFYNRRYEDCIRWYDAHFTPENTSAVNALALSYKAGSLFRLARNPEAAYTFSKAFSMPGNRKKDIFLGFLWATDRCNKALQSKVLSFAKDAKERANIYGMFALYGSEYRLNNLKEVLSGDPSSPLLPVIAVREINKLEEQYLTPLLSKQKGGKSYYYLWEDGSDSIPPKQQLSDAITVFDQVAKHPGVKDPAVFIAGAAYLSFIGEDFVKARSYVSQAKNLRTNTRITEQLKLIDLLISINQDRQFTSTTENNIVEPLKWLSEKAKQDPEYKIFLRNLFSEILAQKYEQHDAAHKAALAYSVADLKFTQKKGSDEEYYYSAVGVEYIRNEMNTPQLLKLYDLLKSSGTTPFDQFLIKHASFNADDVLDVIGTSFLRDLKYSEAIEWFKKLGKAEPLVAVIYNYKTDKELSVNVNPLHDYLNDWQRYEKPLAKPYTKLVLAQKLFELEKKLDTSKHSETKSKLHYQLASILYNMSYYGNSWNAVAYFRSGSDWNEGKYEQPWKKEYYGVYKAKDHYQKAYELTKDKEFKAAALFMVAKCVQRQIPMPAYNYDNYEQYEKDIAVYYKKFQNNPLFGQFQKEFGTTKFYKFTYTRCSYLRDFVTKATRPARK